MPDTEVLEKDKGEKTPQVFDAIKEALRTNDRAKLDVIFGDKANRDIAMEAIKDPKAFSAKYNPAEPPAAKPDPAPAAGAGDPPEVEKIPDKKKVKVEVELDEDELGSYAVGRKPDEAVREALKGNREKDLTIRYLKDERVPELEQLARAALAEGKTLKQKLAEYEASLKKEPPAAEEKKKPDLKSLVPAIPEKDGVFDEDYQKKLRDSILSLTETYEERIARLEKDTKEARDSAHKTDARLAENETRNSIEEQFVEIEKMRELDRRKEVFKSGRPIRDLEEGYHNLLKDVAQIAGIPNPDTILDENGNYRKEIIAAYNTFNDAEKGKELRKKCEDRGVRAPEGLDDLWTAYEIEHIRKTNATLDPASGQYKPLSYAKAFDRYVKDSLDLEKIRMEARRKGQEEVRVASAPGTKAVPEAPPGAGAPPIVWDAVATAEFQALANKTRKTRAEKDRYGELMRVSKAFSEAEIALAIK